MSRNPSPRMQRDPSYCTSRVSIHDLSLPRRWPTRGAPGSSSGSLAVFSGAITELGLGDSALSLPSSVCFSWFRAWAEARVNLGGAVAYIFVCVGATTIAVFVLFVSDRHGAAGVIRNDVVATGCAGWRCYHRPQNPLCRRRRCFWWRQTTPPFCLDKQPFPRT